LAGDALADVVGLGDELGLADALGLAEVVGLGDELGLADALGLADVVGLGDELGLADALGVGEVFGDDVTDGICDTGCDNGTEAVRTGTGTPRPRLALRGGRRFPTTPVPLPGVAGLVWRKGFSGL
jgi:hypothetical protein